MMRMLLNANCWKMYRIKIWRVVGITHSADLCQMFSRATKLTLAHDGLEKKSYCQRHSPTSYEKKSMNIKK
jgi:hypothetical protein